MMRNLVYLDYAASTPIDERVVEAMVPYHGAANPSSSHLAGRDAAQAVEQARSEVASLIGARPGEIIFTSGATEANNLAIWGVLEAYGGGHVVTAASEHRAVLKAVKVRCPTATVLAVDAYARVDPLAVRDALRPDTVLVSIMAANNEVGTLAPITDIAAVCASAGVLFHSDMAQAAGKIPLDVSSFPIDLVSLSAHKMYGPKGVGALWISRHVRERLRPMMHGGGHERGLRPGTLNVAGCVGFGKAAFLARDEGERDDARTCDLRRHLMTRLRELFPNVGFNGDQDNCLSGIVNIHLSGIDADSLLAATPSVAASTGSACNSAAPEPSHVLRAMGRTNKTASECLRLSFGRFTRTAQIDEAVEALAASSALLGAIPAGVNA